MLVARKKKKVLRDEERYANVMGEVKARLFLVGEFIDNKTTTGSDTTDIEFICLQLRKIMELIALASIVPNKNKYKEMRENFEKDYHAKRIFRDLEKINANFYPTAMLREEVSSPGADIQIKKRENVWLTKKRFMREYEKLGGLLHADNPYAVRRPYVNLYKQYKTLTTNLWELMEFHQITFIGGGIQWVVFMHGKNKPVQVLNIEKVK